MPDGSGGGLIQLLLDGISEWIGVMLIALWGGIIDYLATIRKSKKPFKWGDLFWRLMSAGFGGLMASMLAQGFGLSDPLIYVSAGIGGHMGVEVIHLIRKRALKQVGLEDKNEA